MADSSVKAMSARIGLPHITREEYLRCNGPLLPYPSKNSSGAVTVLGQKDVNWEQDKGQEDYLTQDCLATVRKVNQISFSKH
jgi:hypothetical protein